MAYKSGQLRELRVVAVSSDTTIADGAHHGTLLDVTATSAIVTITLPAASSMPNGFIVRINRNSASTKNVAISGGATATLTASDYARTYTTDAAAWIVLDDTGARTPVGTALTADYIWEGTSGGVAAEVSKSANLHVKHGFENRTDSAMTFTDTSPDRTFKIAKTGSGFSYWRAGIKVTKTTDQTVQITNTTGIWFIYFNTSDVLTASQTPWDIESDNVPVAIVYWNGTTNRIQEERHGYLSNRSWHKWAHHTIGTSYESGLLGTFTDAGLSLTQGILHDEDIDFDTGVTLTTCLVWYQSGSIMTFASSTTPYLVVGGALKYDNAGTITSVDSGKYVVNDVSGTLDQANAIYVRVGTAQYSTIADARAAAIATWANVVAQELKLLYRVIYKNNGGTINYVESVDYRTSGTLPGGGTLGIPPHASTHKYGGTDQIASATADAYAIPMAGADGKLGSGFFPFGTTSTTICVGNDSRLSDARSPVGTALTSTYIWVGNGSNVAAAVAMSSDVTMDNTGAVTIANKAITAAKTANITEGSITGTVTLASTDRGKSLICSGTSSDYTVTLKPSGTDFTAGDEIELRMVAALTKLVTLDAGASGLIDGSRYRVMWSGEVARLRYLGSDTWVKISGKSKAMLCTIAQTSNQTIGTASETKIAFDRTDIDNTGMMADLTNDQITIKRASNYKAVFVGKFDSMTNTATRMYYRIYHNDGTDKLMARDEREVSSTATEPCVSIASPIFSLSAAETIFARQYQNTGGNCGTGPTSTIPLYLSVIEVPTW